MTVLNFSSSQRKLGSHGAWRFIERDSSFRWNDGLIDGNAYLKYRCTMQIYVTETEAAERLEELCDLAL